MSKLKCSTIDQNGQQLSKCLSDILQKVFILSKADMTIDEVEKTADAYLLDVFPFADEVTRNMLKDFTFFFVNATRSFEDFLICLKGCVHSLLN